MSQPAPPAPRRLPRTVVALGVVSLLMDISSEMVHSLLPVWLIGGLGASALMLGAIEGVAEALALMVKVVSGVLSDRSGRRKPWALLGYGLGALSKPLFALAPSAGWVLAARMTDRFGKGLRGAPRDALIADVTPTAQRGAAYGLRQSLDTVGAFVGPLLAMALMLLWNDDVRAVFRLAVVPGLLAVFVLWRWVDEPASGAAADGTAVAKRDAAGAIAPPWSRTRLAALDRRFWWLVALGALTSLARISEAFVVLRAHDAGVALAFTPMVLIVLNVVYAAAAYPSGWLSDRLPRPKLLALGLLLLAAADLVLSADAIAGGRHGPLWLWGGVLLWGLHLGMSQGLFSALVADAAPANLRGTAFGVFHLASGAALLIGNVVAGLLWRDGGAGLAFALCAVVAALAAGLALALPSAR